ncbi:MAG: bifunctional phosphopantothenoylcysteine decarboxylase/phosphopantothenate--cysteine ligase CoaBC [Bradymonadales bacterium]|nr:bifunctional phosphopantothenoylcysteine decarboxylase/phosphopantothenate--cysteine ligase CoaBC [Bradymonadales bacterium]
MHAIGGKRVLLGVCGGIAAYKIPALVRELVKRGADVRVVMTACATRFIGPATLQAVSGHPVGLDLFEPHQEGQISHIELARWPDAVLVAPATANLIGRLANGLADDLLTTLLLATTAPVLVAPSMNSKMLEHPMVQANLKRLAAIPSLSVIAPDVGELACQETGPGRLPDPDQLVEALARAMSPSPLSGRRVLVTLGATREWLDEVRFLSNASSGRMGFTMCRSARRLGAEVTAIVGAVDVAPPSGIAVIRVESALEMEREVNNRIGEADIAVFVAAVSDVRPLQRYEGKIPKDDLPDTVPLVENPDILATVAHLESHPFCIGFAAETSSLEDRTMAKCAAKGCELMVGNHVGGGAVFGKEQTQVVVVDSNHLYARLGPADKETVAADVWNIAVELFQRWQRSKATTAEGQPDA